MPCCSDLHLTPTKKRRTCIFPLLAFEKWGIRVELLIYWRLFLANKYLIAGCTLVCLMFSIFLANSTTKTYQSDAQLFVSTPAGALDISSLATGSSFSQQRVKSYAQIINSPLTLAPVIEKLELKVTPEQLSGQISAVAPLDTVLISLSVKDTNPTLAASIANTVAEQFSLVVEDLEMNNSFTGAPVKVSTVRNATANFQPISPNKKVYYLLGILIGILIGFSIAGLRKVLDTTVKNSDDLFGMPLLAAIGFDSAADEKPLITKLGRYAARTESFRTLRTNLKYIIPSIPAKVVAITSSLPNEGKSTTAINLAISFSQGGNSVVLVEADMRRPQLSNYLEVGDKEKVGLSEMLSQSKKMTSAFVDSCTRTYEDTELSVIYSGQVPSNPSELLGSERFEQLISMLRKHYDYVLVDCPPLLPVADAAVISTRVDGVVMIVHAGRTRKHELLGARAAIESVGASILGVVLNKIPENVRGYRYGYAYYKEYGNSYQPQVSSEYAPSEDDLYRIQREEFFERIVGKKFKDELRRESAKYDQ
jgi:succinoglycan biosynthesis transport protein ExoP